MENGKFEIETTSPLESDKLIAMAEIAEKRVAAIKKIKTQALRVTNERDWVDQNGRPYIQSSGSEKIARVFGISWRFNGEPQKVIEEGGHFRYEVLMEFLMSGATIEVKGSRSSKDPFFTTRYEWNDETKKKDKKITLSPSDIDAGDVLKSGITNAIGNGITRILGLRNLDWSDLKDAGLDLDKIGKVEYKTKSKESENGKQQGEKDYPIAKGQKEEITKLLSSIPDDFVRMTKVSEILYGKDVNKIIENLDKVTWKEAKKVIEALNKEKK